MPPRNTNTTNRGNASPAHSETTGTTWSDDDEQQKQKQKQKKQKKGKNNSNNENGSNNNEQHVQHDGKCAAAGCEQDHEEVCTEHFECEVNELAYCGDCIRDHNAPEATTQLHDKAEEVVRKNGNNATNSKKDTHQTCGKCQRSFKVRGDGFIRVHTCVGGNKSAGNDEGTNRQASRERGREIARTSGRQTRLLDAQEEKQDEETQRQHGELQHEIPIERQQRNGTLSRHARRRRHRDSNWAATHTQLLRAAAEEGIDNETFTERLGQILDHTPAGAEKLPKIDNSHKIMENEEGGGNNGNDEEETRVEQMGEEVYAEYRADRERQSNNKSLMQRMHKHIRNNDMTKARQELGKKGLFDVTTVEGSELLRSKYPTDEERQRQGEKYIDSEEHQRHKEATAEAGDMDFQTAKTLLLAFINRKRWGQSAGATGHSNDQYKNIIKEAPEAIGYLVKIADRVGQGAVCDGEQRDWLVMGKGTALRKKGDKPDLRPSTTLNPIYNQSAHLSIKGADDEIQIAIGPDQYAMKSGGIEANGHGITHAIQADPERAAGVIDLWNAYNNSGHAKMKRNIDEHVPKMSKFTKMQIGMTTAKTVYHDRRKGITQVLEHSKGVPQGGVASTVQFCVALHVEVLAPLRREFGDDIIAMSAISDNITVVSNVRKVKTIIERAEELIEQGMDEYCRVEKCMVYSHGRHTQDVIDMFSADENGKGGIQFIPPEGGFMCAGCPIGSDEYINAQVRKKGDDIIDELNKMTELARSTDSCIMGNTVQTLYQMIRMCSGPQFMYLLRQLPPSATEEVAEKIDRAIANTVYAITNTTQLLPPEHSEAMVQQLNRLFLPISKGGNGFASLKKAAAGAFAGSILLTAPLIAQISSDVVQMMEDREMTPAMAEFADIMEELKAEGIQAVKDIDPHGREMWGKASRGMQRQINQEREKLRVQELDRCIPPPPMPIQQARVGAVFDDEQLANRHQQLANKSTEASAWLTANPAITQNKMTDDAFSTSLAIRSGLRVTGSRTHCICGQQTTSDGSHAQACKTVKVRGANRMAMHTAVAKAIRNRLQCATSTGQIQVEKTDPRMSEYFETRGQHDQQYFADIAVHHIGPDKHLVMDVTSTCSLTAYVRDHLDKNKEGGAAAYGTGDAAAIGTARKAEFYGNLFDLEATLPTGEVQLETISLETNGAMDRRTKEVLRGLAQLIAEVKRKEGEAPPLKAEVDLEQRQITQQISVAVQAWRARSVSNSIKYNTLDAPPTNPYIPGSRARIPPLPPPAFMGLPANQRRTHAVAPLPPRRPPGIRGARHDYWE